MDLEQQRTNLEIGMTQCKYILFDFFGTLVEYSDSRTEQGYTRSHAVLLSYGSSLNYQDFLDRWSATFREFDLQSEATHDEYSMDDVVGRFLVQLFGPRVNTERDHIFRDTYLEEWSTGIRYIEGVGTLLSQLAKRCTLALVTNTHSSDLIRGLLLDMNVAHLFSTVVTSVEHGKRKPYASIFKHALSIIGASSENAIYVGDSFAADYSGAKAVGMGCLLIDPNKSAELPDEDRINGVLDLPARLSLR
jgi:putative hydrolase of the HAD superfamily